MNNNVTKKDFIFFQDDILRQIKKLETQLTEKISTSKQSIEEKTTKLEENYTNIRQKVLEINETVNKTTTYNLQKDEKTEKIINDFNAKNEFSINILKKELDEACFKYDKIFVSNLNVPGLIGESCPFANVKLFLEYANRKIIEALSQKEKQEAQFKSYYKKMEVIIGQNKNQYQQVESKIMNYLKGAIKNCNKECENRIKVIEERIDSMRIENGKYTTDLIKKAEELKIKWEKLDDIEKRLNQKYQDESSKIKILFDDIKKEVNSEQEEFLLIKARFTELSEFIKDVRFRKNIKSIFSEMHKFKEISEKMDFNKKQKLDKDDIIFTNSIYKGKDNNKNTHVSIDCDENSNIGDISKIKNIIYNRNDDLVGLNFIKGKKNILNDKLEIYEKINDKKNNKDNPNPKKEFYAKINLGKEAFGSSVDSNEGTKFVINKSLEKKGLKNHVDKEKLLIKTKLNKTKDISKNKDLIFTKNILNYNTSENDSEYVICADSEISINSPKNKNQNQNYFSKTVYNDPFLTTREGNLQKKFVEKKINAKNSLILEESNPITITLNSFLNKNKTKKEVFRSKTITSLNDNKEKSNTIKIENKLNKKEIQKILDNSNLMLPITERCYLNHNSLPKLLSNDSESFNNIPYKKESIKLVVNNLIETPHNQIFKLRKNSLNEKLIMAKNFAEVNDKISKINQKLTELLGYMNQKFLSTAENMNYLSKEIHNLYKIKEFNNNITAISPKILYTKNDFTLPIKLNLSRHKNSSSTNLKEKKKNNDLNNNKDGAIELINVIEPYLVKKFK